MRMFGYSKSEIVGQNVSVIVPQPLSSAHDTYLRNYINTGIEV
jgi:PAS domain S-box-containing protein